MQKGDTHLDVRSAPWPGFNGNRSIYQPNPFSHARETQPLASQRCFDVEACA